MDENDINKLGDKFADGELKPENELPVIIKVVGVGGGGGNAINHMYHQGIKGVSFVVVNTDAAALHMSPVPDKVLIGSGLGAGNIPEVAREAAEADIDKIESIFNDHTEMVFITAGMGGGTGTGAGPVVARVARERGLLTIGIVTIPFMFEGEKKISKALDGADEMGKYVDALLVINNERLAEIYGDLDFINAFGKADDTLSTAARSISELITSDGYINLDFRDVNTTLRNGGHAVISTGYGEGENRVNKAIEDALHSPLLKNCDVMGSKKLLFNLYFSRKAKKSFTMKEMDAFRQFTGTIPGVDVVWGMAFDDTLEDKVKVTVLAAGFDDSAPESPVVPAHDTSGNTPNVDVRIQKHYGGSEFDDKRNNYIVLTPAQMDDEEVIDILERTPAAVRPRADFDKVKQLGETPDFSSSATSSLNNPLPGTGPKISF